MTKTAKKQAKGKIRSGKQVKKRSATPASTTVKPRTTRVGTPSTNKAKKANATLPKPAKAKKKQGPAGPISAAALKKANAKTKAANAGLPKQPIPAGFVEGKAKAKAKRTAAEMLAKQQAANLKQSAKHRDHQAKLVAEVKGEFEPQEVKRPSYITVYNRKKKLPKVPTEGLLQSACFLVQEGAYPRTACTDLGVTAHVWQKWLKAAEENPDGTESLFFTCLAMADARDENDDLQLITRGAKHSAALQWKRERKTGARWGNKITHNVGGVDGAPLLVKQEATLTINSGARILAMLDQAGAIGTTTEEETEGE